MPRSGDRYVMPQGLGEYVVVRSHEDTGGEFVEMEWILPPGAFAPPRHRHPSQVEEYEVLEGRFQVMVDGHWRTLSAGDSASVPVNSDHTFRIPPGEAVRVRNFHRREGASTNSSCVGSSERRYTSPARGQTDQTSR